MDYLANLNGGEGRNPEDLSKADLLRIAAGAFEGDSVSAPDCMLLLVARAQEKQPFVDNCQKNSALTKILLSLP